MGKFMIRIEGEIKDQNKIMVHFLVDEKKQKINELEKTISVVEGKEFSWRENIMMGMKDDHRFMVEAAENSKTRFIQSDLVKGGMTWLLGKSLIKFEEENYPKFNRSLKKEVEKRFN